MRSSPVAPLTFALVLALAACDTPSATDAGGSDAATADAALDTDAGLGVDAGPPTPCGDGTVQAPELCDLGDANGGDECAWDCTLAAPFLAYDAVIERLIDDYDVPGGAVAVMVDGRLVLVRGYGVMDLEGTPTDPLARFRIASISKPITSAAVLQLVQEDRLGLDDLVFVDHLGDLVPAEGTPERSEVDDRIFDITIRHLLHHTGGWDRDIAGGYDPMFIPSRVATSLDVPSPPEPEDIARYMARQPLDFTPGERYAYSNFGYSLLGRVIERVTGVGYEAHVQEHLLRGIGADGMAIGATRLDRVAADESYYFTAPGDNVRTVFDEDGNPFAPRPYGSWYNQSLDSHGGWIASTLDLLRFSGAVDGFASRPDVLDATHLALLTARPEALWPTDTSATYYYAMGWSVRVISPTRQNRWHTGSLPGTSTILVRTADDVAWVALYNHRPSDDAWWGAMDSAMWEAYGTVDSWPDYDLFDRYD